MIPAATRVKRWRFLSGPELKLSPDTREALLWRWWLLGDITEQGWDELREHPEWRIEIELRNGQRMLIKRTK